MIPSDWFFPIRPQAINEDAKSREQLISNLHYNLQEMYRLIAQGINGDIGGSASEGVQQYTPVITGSTGTNGAETYTTQVGWYLRQGLLVDVWFHVAFTGHTGTGNTLLNLPYQAAMTAGEPWQGVCHGGTITYASNYTTLGIQVDGSNSSRAEIIKMGSGQTLTNLGLAGAADFRGHLRYIGVQE